MPIQFGYSPKYVSVAPAFQLGQGALFASMQSYAVYANHSPIGIASAQNSKELALVANTTDVLSALVGIPKAPAGFPKNPQRNAIVEQEAGHVQNPMDMGSGVIR
jgi:hypothetical protein